MRAVPVLTKPHDRSAPIHTQPEAIKEGIERLMVAYKADQKNPMVLNYMADHFFYRKVRE